VAVAGSEKGSGLAWTAVKMTLGTRPKRSVRTAGNSINVFIWMDGIHKLENPDVSVRRCCCFPVSNGTVRLTMHFDSGNSQLDQADSR
jgi:hypothetical protein